MYIKWTFEINYKIWPVCLCYLLDDLVPEWKVLHCVCHEATCKIQQLMGVPLKPSWRKVKPQPRVSVQVAIGQSYQSLVPGNPGDHGTATVCYPQAGSWFPGGENPRSLWSKHQLDCKFCWAYDNHSFQFVIVQSQWHHGEEMVRPEMVSGAGSVTLETYGPAIPRHCWPVCQLVFQVHLKYQQPPVVQYLVAAFKSHFN